MPFRRIGLPTLVLGLAVSGLVAGPVSATEFPSWTAPGGLTGAATLRTIATNGVGDIYSTFQANGVGSFTRDSGGWWNPWVENAPGGNHAVAAVDPDGNVISAHPVDGECGDWYEESPAREDYQIQAAYRPDGLGRWSTHTFPGQWDGCDQTPPAVGVNHEGTATVVWRAGERLLAAQRPPRGRWTQPVPIAAVGAEPQVVASGDNRTTVVWTGEAGAVMTATSSRVGRWSAPRRIASSQGPRELQAESDGDGNVTVGWSEIIGTVQDRDVRIRTVSKPAGAPWQEPQTVVSTTGRQTARNLDLAVHGGGAAVVWFQGNTDYADDNAVGAVRVSVRRNGRWRQPVLLGRSLSSWTRPSVAANNLGVMAVWSGGDDSAARTVVSLKKPGATWSSSRQLSPSTDVTSGGSTHAAVRSPEVVAYRPKMFAAIFRQQNRVMFRDYVADSTAPRARVVLPAGHYLGLPWMPVHWAGTDDLTGARAFDVRVRSAGRGGRLSGWSNWVMGTTATSKNFRVEPQRTYCFSARARDRVGNLGRWGRSRCVATPIDDRAFTASPRWSRGEGRNAYRQTLTVTRSKGERLAVGGVTGRQVSLVARTCPECGVVRVTHAGRDLGTLDLSSDSVQVPRVLRLPGFEKRLTGKVVIHVVSRGKPVAIDGIVVRR